VKLVRFSTLIAALMVFCCIRAEGVDNRGFEVGRQAYADGDYATAKTANASTDVSAGSLHNLGNAEFKLGHVGPAILAWERAHALDPNFRNTTANLRFARAHAGLSEVEAAWNEKYSAIFSPDTWLWTATGAFWGAVALLALPSLLKRKRTAWTQGGAVVAIGVFLLTLPALAGISMRGRLGVVMAAETILRLTPTKEGELLGKLAEGELARVEKKRGEYIYVRAATDRAGWVRADEFEKIWP
jgi:uncharacterized protein YgiM (DUF1202 family)